ncbi:MAG: putative sugar nucleotidyl transferase [Gemmatimonadota bacterium]|nr:putative sugar nucleotidyl transferase [Gemmatimonadota bacterium]
MTSGFVLYDDAAARALEPFALTRPWGEVRAGALAIRERWSRLLGTRARGTATSPHLATFDETGAPRAVRGALSTGTVIVNARFAPALRGAGDRLAALAPGGSLRAGGRVAAVALATPLNAAVLADGALDLDDLARGRGQRVDGWWMDAPWDLVAALPAMLAADAAVLATECDGDAPHHVAVLGEHRLVVAPGAYVEPHVVVDTTEGDVIVHEGARVGAFARIAGPAVIAAHARLAGGRYSCVSIGPHSRACGEMSVVVVDGYSNKAHDGFVGHTAIGRWANLGAGTITSNLKNSYGPVRVRDARGEHDTGQQFLGSLVGDHAKTAIGTRLTTGTIIGAGANVFGDRTPDKYVPPFAWGDRAPFAQYNPAKFLSVAATVMKRRQVRLSAGMKVVLAAAAAASGPASRRRRR